MSSHLYYVTPKESAAQSDTLFDMQHLGRVSLKESAVCRTCIMSHFRSVPFKGSAVHHTYIMSHLRRVPFKESLLKRVPLKESVSQGECQ